MDARRNTHMDLAMNCFLSRTTSAQDVCTEGSTHLAPGYMHQVLPPIMKASLLMIRYHSTHTHTRLLALMRKHKQSLSGIRFDIVTTITAWSIWSNILGKIDLLLQKRILRAMHGQVGTYESFKAYTARAYAHMQQIRAVGLCG